jgi:hypothetical protein
MRPSLPSFEPIDQQNGTARGTHQSLGQPTLKERPPTEGQPIQVQGVRMKEMQQAIITGRVEAQSADQTRDPAQVGPEAQAGQHHGQP